LKAAKKRWLIPNWYVQCTLLLGQVSCLLPVDWIHPDCTDERNESQLLAKGVMQLPPVFGWLPVAPLTLPLSIQLEYFYTHFLPFFCPWRVAHIFPLFFLYNANRREIFSFRLNE